MIEDILHLWKEHPTADETPMLIYECDRCGTSVAGPNDACPYCEDSRIVTFEL